MTRLGTRTERARTAVTWLLILGFFAQPILTYLVTPTVTQTREGFRAVVCTLQGGYREVEIDLPSIDDTAKALDHCPAIKLIQLAGTVQPSEPPVPLHAVLYAVAVPDQPVSGRHPARPLLAYTSRAPPALPLV